MNSFSDILIRRRSIRQFTDQALTPEEVQALLSAALRAPSSMNRHSTRFILVEDKETLKALSYMRERGCTFLSSCAVGIVVLGCPMECEPWVEDASLAAGYMQLQAEALGLGSCWAHVYNKLTPNGQDAAEYVRQLLHIPYQLEVLCVIGVGHKGEDKAPREEESLKWEHVFLGEYPTEDTTADTTAE